MCIIPLILNDFFNYFIFFNFIIINIFYFSDDSTMHPSHTVLGSLILVETYISVGVVNSSPQLVYPGPQLSQHVHPSQVSTF